MSIHKRKVTIITECELEEKGNVISVRLGKEFFFVSRKDFQAALKKHPHGNVVSMIEKLKRYSYYTQKELDSIFKNIQYQAFIDKVYETFGKNSLREIKKDAFNESRVLFFYDYAHLFYPLDSTMPMSIPYYMDYIKGDVCNNGFDLDKAEAILKKNPWVSEIQRIDIPYYNREEGKEKALQFKVLLPQDVWESMVKRLRKKDPKNPDSWSCNIHYELVYRSWYKTDLLNLKLAYIGKKEGLDY